MTAASWALASSSGSMPCAKLRKAISDLLLLTKHAGTSHASHATPVANELQEDSHRITATAGLHSFPFLVLPRQGVPSSDHTFSCG